MTKIAVKDLRPGDIVSFKVEARINWTHPAGNTLSNSNDTKELKTVSFRITEGPLDGKVGWATIEAGDKLTVTKRACFNWKRFFKSLFVGG